MLKPDAKSVKTLTEYAARSAIRPEVSAAARQLQEKIQGGVNIRWNSRTGTPRSIRGGLTAPEQGSAQEIAVRFLAEHRPLFGIQEDLSALRYVQTKECRGMRHVRFRQSYRNIPVFGAEISVHIDQANQVHMVNGEYRSGIAVKTESVPVTEQAAIQKVLTALRLESSPPPDVRIERVIFPRGSDYYLVYQVSLSVPNPLGSWVYFVDAATGAILDSYNAMRFLKGTGSIYNANPKRDDNEVVTAQLFDLTGDRTLSGMYFKIENSAGDEAKASSDAHEFMYAATDPHFDEVMVYYHLDKAGKFFRTLGFIPPIKPMMAHVHVLDPYTQSPDYDNAYYSPFKQAFFFGHGKRFNDLAKEDAVIYHEFTHAVIDAAQPVMGTSEAGALHEGYADYFACSLTNDPQIGEYVVEKLGKANLRNLRRPKTYAEFTGLDEHADGEIWGVTCWKIREALGEHVADMVLYESLWFLPANATFADATDGILQADTELFGGDHVPDLEAIFTEQKILLQPEIQQGYERTVMVPGNTKWMDTGVNVAVGDAIIFAAHGTVIYDNRGSSCGPEGASWTDSRDKEDPLWRQPHAGLIGKIGGTGQPFFTGKTLTMKAGISGTLLLGVNDYWYQGNSGEFTVTIRVSKGT